MKTLKHFPTLLFILILLLIISSCEKDDVIEKNDDSGLAEQTVKIEDSEWRDNLINVDDSNYTFTFSKNILDNHSIKKGSIIVSTANGGYLRKVKDISVSEDEVTITTEFAAITEAFKELHEQNSATLIPNLGSDEFWLGDGVALNTQKGTAAKLMDFSINKILYDFDNNKATETDQIRISGSYTMDASFSIDVDIEDFEIQNLMLQYEITQNKVINGYLGIGGIEYSDRAKLAVIPCGVIPAGPIVIEPVITLWAGFAVNLSASIQLNSEQRYSSLTTLTYQTGDWNTEKTITEDEIFEPPSISGILSAKLYIMPELSFKVYRVLSPYINAELYGAAKVELESDLLKWKTSIGLGMNAGVKMEIWKRSLFDFSANLFEWEHIIAQGEIEKDPVNLAPVADFSGNPLTVEIGQSVQFTDLSINSPNEWRWIIDGEEYPENEPNPLITFTSEGKHTIALNVMNDWGSDIKTKEDYITVTDNSVPNPNDLLQDLISYWKFDEVSGNVAADSYGNNNGSAGDERVFSSAISGISGTCADFTQGNDYIASTSTPFNFGYDPFTFSAWVKINGAPGSDDWGTIIEKNNYGAGHKSPMLLVLSDGRVSFGAAGWYSNPREIVISTTKLDIGVWYHLVGVRGKDSQKIYIDGKLEASESMTNLNSGNSYKLFIGKRQTGDACAFNGYIDEVGIWKRELSPEEVSHLSNNKDWFDN